jgi:formate hydrogenlyase subunit 4
MKMFVLLTIFWNVLVTPWGLAGSTAPLAVAVAVLAILVKMAVAALAIAFIDSSFAKLRLLRVAEYLGAAFVISLLAVITFTMGV